MNRILKLVVSTLLLTGTIQLAQAETQYVTEDLTTFLRRGAGDNFKITGTIKAGEEVTVLNRQDRYSLIRDSKNRQAWILSSELSSMPSSKNENPKLKAQLQELTQKLNRIDADWQQRTQEMQRRAKDSDQRSSQLLEENTQLKRELEITKNKNRDLESLLDAEKREITIQWFIYGGSVLGVGLLLGLIIPFMIPKRRRSEWE